jgi:hypothetical protein
MELLEIVLTFNIAVNLFVAWKVYSLELIELKIMED